MAYALSSSQHHITRHASQTPPVQDLLSVPHMGSLAATTASTSCKRVEHTTKRIQQGLPVAKAAEACLCILDEEVNNLGIHPTILLNLQVVQVSGKGGE